MNPKQTERNRRLRFTWDDDNHFLREVVGQNPFKNVEKWSLIQMNVSIITGKSFKLKTLKQHLMLLLEAFMKKEKYVISGVEEYHSERHTLLQEAHMLYTENYNKITQKKKIISEGKQIRMAGEQVRETIAEELLENDPLLLIEEEIVNPIEIVSTHEQTDHETKVTDHNYVTQKTSVEETEQHITGNDSQNEIVRTPLRASTLNRKILNRTVQGRNRRRNYKASALRKVALSHLRERNRENEKKNRELELEERKILLEEKKYELEVRKLKMKENEMQKEAEEKLERSKLEKKNYQLEMTEKRKLLELLETQQKAILALCHALTRKAH